MMRSCEIMCELTWNILLCHLTISYDFKGYMIKSVYVISKIIRFCRRQFVDVLAGRDWILAVIMTSYEYIKSQQCLQKVCIDFKTTLMSDELKS